MRTRLASDRRDRITDVLPGVRREPGAVRGGAGAGDQSGEMMRGSGISPVYHRAEILQAGFGI